MNAVSDKKVFDYQSVPVFEFVADTNLEVTEAYWGYVLRTKDTNRTLSDVLQAFSLFGGVCLLFVAAAMWLNPAAVVSGEVLVFKLGTSGAMAAAGGLFVHFATRGTYTELQVDVSLSEIREVVRNRSGAPTLLGRYAFNAVDSVYIDRSGANGQASLIMRYRNSAQLIEIANGDVEWLEGLRDRLGRDILTDRRTVVSSPARARRRVLAS